ncbi:hypothetical protein AWB76_05188 [Caballeronia temeraria]|uniref:Uncharacterized protein n=2 Tax=Caballeronia temeraria TaxID=1777137 RepID=A0A158C6W0_9BURK|nr:hypothetical protein AWB76_05188 [Caballeronia temeraria]
MNVTLNLGGSGEGFGIVQLGGHDYGSNSLGVWLSGNVRMGLSDTVSGDLSGVGVFDARLSPDDMKLAKEIHRRLCKAAEDGPVHEVRVVEPSAIYDVDCIRDGKLINKTAKMYELPEELFNLMHRFNSSMTQYLPDARTVVKLDVRVARVERAAERFRVSIEFRNGGPNAISFRRPDDLEPDQGDRLNVQGSLAGGSVFWETNLAGATPVDASDISGKKITTPGGRVVTYVTVAPYSSLVFEFDVLPKLKIPHGLYSFNLVAALDASAPDVAPSLGFVDFHSDYQHPCRVTFDRDYPSTPEEWKDFESRKAKEVSALPTGAMVAESGYYRMVSVFGPRSQFVTRLEAGKAAPRLDANNWDTWEWEADLARSTICKPADACTREGIWVLRKMADYVPKATDETHESYTRRVRTGDSFPSLNVPGTSKLYWEWLGV